MVVRSQEGQTLPYKGRKTMTVKLYENDSYIREFEATVISCEKVKNGYLVVLDKTAFFPEGGGQQADTGTINGATVSDVQIKDEIITHLVDREFVQGETVSGVVDWDIRYRRMQGHTGEHLVSGIIHTMFGYDNLGFHMSENTMTLDPSGILTFEDIKEVELRANKAIYENRAISVSYPSVEQLKTLEYRSKLDLTEGVRLVTIDGYDVCACCAPHVKSTGEIGVIKIVDYIQYKGGMRLTMVCGQNAFEDYAKLHNDSKQMMHLLSASRDKVLEFVMRDHELIGALKSQINSLKQKLVLAQLQTQMIGTTMCCFTKDASFDDLRNCVKLYADKGDVLALFSENDDGSYSYVIASESLDVRDTVKALNAEFNGKGGGRPNYAQGKIEGVAENIIKFFENKF